MNSTITAAVFAACIAIVAAAIVFISSHHDTSISTTASCVQRIAKEQHYSGNPNGEEAWNLFASQCK